MVIDEVLDTADIAEAEAHLSTVYDRSRVIQTEEPFVFRQAVRGDERVTIAHYEITPRVEFSVDFAGVLAIGSVASGAYRAVSDGAEVDPSQPFVMGPGRGWSWSERLDITMVNIDPGALRAFAGVSPSRHSKLKVARVTPISNDRLRHWDVSWRYVAGVYSDDLLLRNDLIRRSATDTILAALLASFAVEAGQDQTTADGASSAALRRAVRFIEDNAAEPIGLEEIAEAARLSHRGVQELFRRELGLTPTGYLRSVRLDAARADLISAADDDTVADIARRWGFAHLPRFASYYRSAYGEYPSQTLRA